MGIGLDVSLSANVVTGMYVGLGKPSAESLSGASFYENLGTYNYGGFQDVNRDPLTTLGTVGKNWLGGSNLIYIKCNLVYI